MKKNTAGEKKPSNLRIDNPHLIATTKEETRHFLCSRHHFRVHVGGRVALVDRDPVGFRGAVIQEDLRVEVG